MAENFFVVFNEEETLGSQPLGRTAGKEGKTIEPLKTAKFVKMAAENVADAQAAVAVLYPSDTGSLPVVVKEAAWKTS